MNFATQIFFRAYKYSLQDSRDYEHFVLQVFHLPYETANQESTVTLTWQRNVQDVDDLHWYGGHVVVENDNESRFLAATKLANRLCKDLLGWNSKPEEFLERLRRMKAVETVYDPRFNKYVPIGEVLSDEYMMWSDDNELLGRRMIEVSVEARDEDEARTLIEQEISGNKGHFYNDMFRNEWRMMGRPVKSWRGRESRPETIPALELCRLEAVNVAN